jgi:hypothetical protein
MSFKRTIEAIYPRDSRSLSFSIVLVIPVILFVSTPPSGAFTLDVGRILPPSLWSIISILNFFLFDRLIFRGIIAAGYVIQNRSRIMNALPVAITLVQQLVELIFWLTFGFPVTQSSGVLRWIKKTGVSLLKPSLNDSTIVSCNKRVVFGGEAECIYRL